MKKSITLVYSVIDLLSIIALYYIVGSHRIFLYVLSLSLYNVFISCFSHLSLKEYFKKIKTTKTKQKLFKYLLLVIAVISFIFLLVSILFSDLIGIFLKINDTLPIFIVMALSIALRPMIKLMGEYYEANTKNSNYSLLVTMYDTLDRIFVLIIAILSFYAFKIDNIMFLYLSKFIAFILVVYFLYFTRKIRNNYKYIDYEDKINYKKTIRNILKNNISHSVIEVVKYSYYYISIVIVYLVLSTRYAYQTIEIENIITFTYFYALTIINYLVYLAKLVTESLPENTPVTDKLYQSFKMMLTIAIVFGVISPLTCKLIFLDPSKSVYLIMVNFMAIFILLFDITYEYIKNKIVIYISLFTGLILKIILIVPIMNAFYRMGYNLVYGDIFSTIIAMFISVIINYIYIRNTSKNEGHYFEKILDILFDNIILAIILILIQVIIPIDPNDYFKALGLMTLYLVISIIYIKIKNKKRG